ncbi:phage tail tape measure protein [Galactobacillus timonensis]|uniref:phage tail tape measure protein n=1 Tax=Galactobacillus timonensis TaxID=2041840 RepID=UPI000C81CCE0|nr:phage tail tape measure protein [Galactobacillus timonensis]
MADKRIKGITVEIGGNTTKLQSALKDVDAQLRDTQSSLKEVNKLLRLDPSNTELLEQKQKYLSDAIDETKQKLETEKTALEQLKNSDSAGETAEQQAALTREIEKTTQQLSSLEDQYKQFGSVAQQQIATAGESISSVGDKISKAGGSITGVGTTLTKTVTAPIAGVAAASVAAWKSVDEAMDTITTKTGASGEALEDMQNRAKSIAETIPTSFQTAADAVGEVSTRFGLTGDDLEQLSTQFVKFSSLNNTEVSASIDSVSAALAAYGQGAEDASNLLDALNSVGQATGVSVDTLAQDVTKSAAQFTAMGMSAEEAAAVVGAADMAGLDASVMLAGLTKAQKNATEGGKTLSQSLADFSGVMNSNASDTEKLQAAYDTFGSKAGAAIYNAVSSGSLSLDALSGSLADYAGSVSDTFAETQDPIDQMIPTLNSLKSTAAELVTTAGPMITEALTVARDAITRLKEAWDGLTPEMQETIVKAALIAAAVGPVVTGIGGVVTAVGSITAGIGNLVTAAAPVLAAIGPAGWIVAAIAAGVALVIANWDTIGPAVSAVLDGIKGAFSDAWNAIKDGITWLWDSVIKPYYQFWIDLGASLVGGVKDRISEAIDWVRDIPGKIASVWDSIRSIIKLPHFSISGSFSLTPPSVPHLSVDWYKSAYTNAVAFTSPTVLATPNGYKGFGDGNGAELVIGQNALLNTISSAVRSANPGSITVNVYPSQGMDERAIADYTIDRLTQQLAIQSGRF